MRTVNENASAARDVDSQRGSEVPGLHQQLGWTAPTHARIAVPAAHMLWTSMPSMHERAHRHQPRCRQIGHQRPTCTNVKDVSGLQ
jgi:hypothetical protein